MNILPILALIFAGLESLALWKKWRGLEYVAKPAVMVCLFTWLYLATGLQGVAFWFGVGLIFSLAGDVLLMLSLERMFVFGLLAFLLAHIAYLAGFQNELRTVSFWSVLLIFIIAVNALRLMRRIISAMRANGQDRLVNPVIVYSSVISVMLYAAMTTLSNPAWKAGASLLVGLGAFLFYASDLVLAWNKFVAPIQNGRMINIGLYHLGQISLIAGIVSQLG